MMSVFSRSSALLAVALLTASAAQAQEPLPAGAKVVRLEAWPATVALKNPFDSAQVLLTAHLSTGDKVDVTRSVKCEPSAVARFGPTGLVRPAADGEDTLRFQMGDRTVNVPVKVAGQKEKYQVSFVRDVMPAMSKMGCNAGTCHGAQSGKNGFKLSLRGYDPLFDHLALTDDLEGRRFNRAAPETSLMLLKLTGDVPHQGGVVANTSDPNYEMLKLWIGEGVKLDRDSPRVKSIDVFPKGPVIPLPGGKQQMAVIATYTDGAVRDVTAHAFVESSNTEIATVDKGGLVTAVRRGEAAMMARFEGSYAASTLIVMGDRSGYAWKQVPEFNWIDTLVYEKLRQVKVLPSEVCSDEDFIRRVTIDLTGLPPSSDDVRKFLADKRDTKVKREELVDRLIGSPDFVEHWTNKWADLLQVNRKFLGDQGAAALRKYIRDAVEKNTPYDKFVYSILTATGSTMENPAAAYYKVLRDPTELVENTTQLFLAVRFNCNKCHDHPFERWTQDQYYHLAAYFSQVGRAEDPKYKGQKIAGTAVEGAQPLVEVISDKTSGDVKHDRTGQVSPPKFPYEHKDQAPLTASRREQAARWITSRENQYFARSYVNRVWSYLMGVGIIEPVDDIRAGNPPSNPKLLDRMTDEFVKSDFNVRVLMQTICKSRAYQHSVASNKWNEDDEINYSRALARRLPAETLFDSIHRTLGASSRLPGNIRAAQLVDSNLPIASEFLAAFGKPPRESACECERSGGVMLGPVLNLINGPILAEALKDPNSRLNKLAEAEKDDLKLIEEVYLSVLNRKPTKHDINNVGLPSLSGAAADHARMVAEHDKRKAALDAHKKTQPERMAVWEKNFVPEAAWTVLELPEITSAGNATFTRQPDGSILVSGQNPEKDTYTAYARTDLKGITGVRLEVFPDDSLKAKGPGRSDNGNFVLQTFSLEATPADNETGKRKVPFQKPQATFSQEGGFEIAKAVDNNPTTGWAIAAQFGKKQTAMFEVRNPVTDPNGTILTFKLEQQFGAKHTIGRFRLSVTTSKAPFSLTGPPADLVKALKVEPAQRTPKDLEVLKKAFEAQDAELQRLQRDFAEVNPVATPRQLGVQDLAWALINSKEFLFNH